MGKGKFSHNGPNLDRSAPKRFPARAVGTETYAYGRPRPDESERRRVVSCSDDQRTVRSGVDPRGRIDDGDGRVVGEVTLVRSDGPGSAPDPPTADHVFSDGSRSVYRFNSASDDCPCGKLPRHGCPVRDVRADSGSLLLSFVASDLETLRDVVADLRTCCETVRVRRLTRSAPDDRRSLLVIDRTAFTDRQYEVLRTAHEMGYFALPRESDAAEVAAALGVSTATFSEHLSVAQRKLLDQLLAV